MGYWQILYSFVIQMNSRVHVALPEVRNLVSPSPWGCMHWRFLYRGYSFAGGCRVSTFSSNAQRRYTSRTSTLDTVSD